MDGASLSNNRHRRSKSSGEKSSKKTSAPLASIGKPTKKTSAPPCSGEKSTKKASAPLYSVEKPTKKTSAPPCSAEKTLKKASAPPHSAEKTLKKTSAPAYSTDIPIKKTSLPPYFIEALTKRSSSHSHSAENLTRDSSSIASFSGRTERRRSKTPPPTLPKPTIRLRHLNNDTSCITSIPCDNNNGVGNAKRKIDVSIDEIERLAQAEIRRKLDDVPYNDKLVTRWCKDISNGIRDKLRAMTLNSRKVTVTTYIGSKTTDNGANVSVRCQKHQGRDDFVTIAMEGDDMFVWVSMFLADYG